jgi:hypothetical protein
MPSQRRLTRLRRLLPRLALSFTSFCLTLLVLELLVRAYFAIKPAHRPRLAEEVIPAGAMVRDDELGWKTAENHRFAFQTADAAGTKSFLNYSTQAHGFRHFPPLENRTKPRILVIGDSFTMAAHVSDNETYPFLLSQRLDADVFAYGAGGYGSLQEYMILDKYLNLIRPDCVVLQFCSNDFINNNYLLQIQAGPNRMQMRAPYLQPDGSILYAIPQKHRLLYSLANNYSKLLYLVLVRLNNRSTEESSVERQIGQQGIAHREFQESKKITSRIIKRMKERCGGTPLFVFCVDDYPAYSEFLRDVLRANDIPFIPGVAEAVLDAEKQGKCVREADGSHWNALGHSLAAQVLADYLSPCVKSGLAATRPTASACAVTRTEDVPSSPTSRTKQPR